MAVNFNKKIIQFIINNNNFSNNFENENIKRPQNGNAMGKTLNQWVTLLMFQFMQLLHFLVLHKNQLKASITLNTVRINENFYLQLCFDITNLNIATNMCN